MRLGVFFYCYYTLTYVHGEKGLRGISNAKDADGRRRRRRLKKSEGGIGELGLKVSESESVRLKIVTENANVKRYFKHTSVRIPVRWVK